MQILSYRIKKKSEISKIFRCAKYWQFLSSNSSKFTQFSHLYENSTTYLTSTFLNLKIILQRKQKKNIQKQFKESLKALKVKSNYGRINGNPKIERHRIPKSNSSVPLIVPEHLPEFGGGSEKKTESQIDNHWI